MPNPYDDMPRAWVHPHTMVGIRLFVWATVILLCSFFVVLGCAQ
jgi:hypothetical protein